VSGSRASRIPQGYQRVQNLRRFLIGGDRRGEDMTKRKAPATPAKGAGVFKGEKKPIVRE